MKIALLFNSLAGRKATLSHLRENLVRAGHELVRVIENKDEADRLIDPPAELVVAAGGDGTIAAAARAIAGTELPLAVIPLGTANNVAFTLGLNGAEGELAAWWHDARRLQFDLGIVRGDWGTRRFVEGAGGGLIETCLRTFQRRPVPPDEPPPWQLLRALRRYADTLARLEPRPWVFSVDGARRTGEYLMVEVLNARAVGPNLELAPGTNPFDGQLSVVTAREEHREMLAAYVADLLGGRESKLILPLEPATHIEVLLPQALHVDDIVVEGSATAVSIDVEPGAVTVLLPPK